MELFVKFEVFETITGTEQVAALRQMAGAAFQRILSSGKAKASGIFTDARSGFFVIDTNSADEMFELLGSELIDTCHIETHPITSFEKLGEFFEKHPPT